MFGAKTIVMLSVVAALTLGGGVYAVAENLHRPLPPQKSATEFAPRPVPAKPIPQRAKDPSHKPPLPPSLAEKPPQGIIENGQAPLPPRYAIRISGKPNRMTATGCRYGPARYATIPSKDCWSCSRSSITSPSVKHLG